MLASTYQETESFGNTANSFGLIRLGERPLEQRVRVETELGTIANSYRATSCNTIAVSDVEGKRVTFSWRTPMKVFPLTR